MTVDINHIQTGEENPVTHGSVEVAMITREQYDLWFKAYLILEYLKREGLVLDGDLEQAHEQVNKCQD